MVIVTNSDSGSEWFQVSEDFWKDPHEIRSKLRLLADQNISNEVVSELRAARVSIATARELGVDRHEDEDLLAFARKNSLVILTTEADFWSDQRFPLESGGGVILIEAPPSDVRKCLRCFGLAYGAFLKSIGGDAARGTRIRAWADHFRIKSRSAFGGRAVYDMKLEKGCLWAREISSGIGRG